MVGDDELRLSRFSEECVGDVHTVTLTISAEQVSFKGEEPNLDQHDEIRKAVAAECERCAKIVETLPMPHRWQGDPLTGIEVREIIAAAIRKGEP